jgi:DNA-binding Xre family transcriptional regulator
MAQTATTVSKTVTKTKIKPRQILWRTRVVMAERGIRSVSALCRKLGALGVDISESQLGRIIDGKSSHFNATVVGGLLAALECNLTDLFAVR